MNFFFIIENVVHMQGRGMVYCLVFFKSGEREKKKGQSRAKTMKKIRQSCKPH